MQAAAESKGLLKQTFSQFFEDDCTTMAAALSYYTVFALPPLLVIVIAVAGFVLDPAEVEQTIGAEAGNMIGPEAAQQIQTMVSNASDLGQRGGVGLALGIAGLLFGATGAFVQMQQALNRAWKVAPDPEQGGIWNFISKRLTSLGMILAIAFLLLVSLALSTAISVLGSYLAGFLPGGASEVLLFVIDIGLSLLVITLLFAAIYRIMPDANITWSDVGVGAFATALLFVIGKFLVGFYLGQSNPGEAFGAAGSLAIILIWVYYSAMIFLLGAEFTQAWAERKGSGIEPEEGAVRMVHERRVERAPEEGAGADRPSQNRLRAERRG